MKKFAILFAAICMVTFFTSQESFAQCGGGGYRGGGGFYGGSSFNRSYRPSVGFSYGNFNRGPYYGRSFNSFNSFGRSTFGGGNFYRGGFGRGVSIRF